MVTNIGVFEMNKTIDTELILTAEDPILRLNQLCEQGNFRYEIFFTVFPNGKLISCALTDISSGKQITNEVQFVKTVNEEEANRTIAAILLQNIGLGDESEDESEEEYEDRIVKTGLDIAGVLLHKVLEGIGNDSAEDTKENEDINRI